MRTESSGIGPIMWKHLVSDGGGLLSQSGQIVLGSHRAPGKTTAAEGRQGGDCSHPSSSVFLFQTSFLVRLHLKRHHC